MGQAAELLRVIFLCIMTHRKSKAPHINHYYTILHWYQLHWLLIINGYDKQQASLLFTFNLKPSNSQGYQTRCENGIHSEIPWITGFNRQNGRTPWVKNIPLSHKNVSMSFKKILTISILNYNIFSIKNYERLTFFRKISFNTKKIECGTSRCWNYDL